MNRNLVPVPLSDLSVEEESDCSLTIIVHHTGVCKAIKLNDLGAAIWEMIDGKKTIAEILRQLQTTVDHQHSVPAEQLAEDLFSFLCSMEEVEVISLLDLNHTDGEDGL